VGRILNPHHALTYLLFVFDEGERWLCEYFFPAGSHCPAGIVLDAIWFHGLAAFSYRLTDILSDPGAVSRAGRKGATKVFKHRRKSPWVPTLTGHFQTVKRMLAPDWAQKMLCIVVPNRRIVSPEFFPWVRTRRLFSHHSCPVRSPSCPNQKWRHYRWVEKRFGFYQQKQFNLHRQNSVSEGSQCIVNNRKFKMQQRRESKKCNSLTRQNNNFARASSITLFCTFLCRHCTTTTWKCLISRFVKDVK